MGRERAARQANKVPGEDMAIVAMLLAATGLCLMAGTLFDATSEQQVVWNYVGLGLGVVAALGAVTEVEDLTKKETWSDFGFGAIVLLLGAGCFVIAIQANPGGPWNGILRAFGFGLVLLGIQGITSGFIKAWHARRNRIERGERKPGIDWPAILVAFLAAATATANFVNAIVD